MNKKKNLFKTIQPGILGVSKPKSTWQAHKKGVVKNFNTKFEAEKWLKN